MALATLLGTAVKSIFVNKATKAIKDYTAENAKVVGRVINTVTGGKADESLSARAGLKAEEGRIIWKFVELIIDLLTRWFDGKDHCKKEAIKKKIADEAVKKADKPPVVG